MIRPHAPFNLRPVKSASTRKALSSFLIEAADGDTPKGIRKPRRPIKTLIARALPELKVAGRTKP